MKRKSFCVENAVSVQFLGEAGEDAGGLTREFWFLLYREIRDLYFEGTENRMVPRAHVTDDLYYYIGQLIAMGIVQGSSGVPFIAPPVYDYLCGMDIDAIDVTEEDIPLYEVRDFLKKVSKISDTCSMHEICKENLHLLCEANYNKSLQEIVLNDRVELSSSLLRYYVLYRCKKEMDHLRNGLSVFGLRDALATYGNLLRPLFIDGLKPPLTADMIIGLIAVVMFSEPGTNDLIKEKATYMFFVDLLHDIENQVVTDITLGEILNFFTGSDYLPTLGFDTPLCINFNPTNIFPVASTCASQLTLPLMYYDNEAVFMEKMIYAILNHGGFGNY